MATHAWIARAHAAVVRVALHHTEFTTDDVWEEMGSHAMTGCSDNRAMGSVMRDAAAAGTIYRTNRFRVSSMGVCHGRPKRVWRSNSHA